MTTPTLDQVFATLSDPQRRLVCRYVAAADAAVSLEDLVTFVADSPAATPSSTPRCDRRSQIETRLYHVHLPKLADADIIDYDVQRKSITSDSALPLAIDLLQTAADSPEATTDVMPLE